LAYLYIITIFTYELTMFAPLNTLAIRSKIL